MRHFASAGGAVKSTQKHRIFHNLKRHKAEFDDSSEGSSSGRYHLC